MTRNPRRRTLLAASVAGCAALAALACGPPAEPPVGPVRVEPHLTARPLAPTMAAPVGKSFLGLGGSRDGVLYVPSSYRQDTPTPLVVALHGNGGAASNWESWHEVAEERGFIFLALDSRGGTWDLVTGDFGADVTFMDLALRYVFEHANVRPDRVALLGFSDGASYGLSLGVLNGDLFTHLVAFSPGFFAPLGTLVGKPRVFASHGDADPVLSVQWTRDLVVAFEGQAYDITYREFQGVHGVPLEVALEGMDWFLAGALPAGLGGR